MTIDWPSSRTDRCRKASRSAEALESRLPVGSSAKTRSGLLISARAQATRCCCPPDSSPGRCESRSAMPSCWRGKPSHSRSGLRPARRDGQRDVLGRGQRRHQVEVLEDEADAVAPQPGEPGVVELPDVLTAHVGRARGRPVQARHAVHERRLARAGRAHDGREPAALECHADVASARTAAWPAPYVFCQAHGLRRVRGLQRAMPQRSACAGVAAATGIRPGSRAIGRIRAVGRTADRDPPIG